MITDERVLRVLAEYRQRMAAEDTLRKSVSRAEWLSRRDEFLLDVGEAVGELMNIFIRETRARAILECGTSYGYSTVWLADAARATGGKVITLDLKAEKQTYAREMLARAGLADYVTFRSGDAPQLIRQLTDSVDFVLIDVWKDIYIACFDAVVQKAAAGTLIVADNMIFPPDNQANAAEYREHIRRNPRIESVLLPVGHGIEVSRYV
jgi:predicted O-methyltransferase YrrM